MKNALTAEIQAWLNSHVITKPVSKDGKFLGHLTGNNFRTLKSGYYTVETIHGGKVNHRHVK